MTTLACHYDPHLCHYNSWYLDMKTLDPLLARWKDVVIIFMLRLAIAPCVESVILLDRLLYLREQGKCYHP